MMDYSHPPYYTGAHPYPFINISPLTPSHSNPASDDFNNMSPPEVYEQFPNGLPQDQFQNFDSYAPFNPPQPFPAPPTPPNQHAAAPSTAHNSAVPVSLPPSIVDGLSGPVKAETDDQSRRQGSNSDEDEVTPAQSRRKAQNRAAQRAFRERKERHVKDLETRLQQLEQAQQQAVTENERLKRDLHKVSTENEILRATSSMAGGSPGGSHGAAPMVTTGPTSYKPTDFYANVLQGHDNKTPSHRIVTSDAGDRLLGAGATWEYIMSHELFRRGLVDIQGVSDRLKPHAKCDGQGPVFEERTIIRAIEDSVSSSSDELL